MLNMDQATIERIRKETAERAAKQKADLERLGITQAMLDSAGREIERDNIYGLYREYRELVKVTDESIYLSIKTDDDGGIVNAHGYWWFDWSTAESGVEKIKAEIERIKAEMAE